MCAFIPARANWSGATPRVERHSKSGAQARGASRGLCSWRSDGVEEEVREGDVELLQEARVGEGRARELRLHGLRHLEVEAREAGDAVRSRQRLRGSPPSGRPRRRRSPARSYVSHVLRYGRPGTSSSHSASVKSRTTRPQTCVSRSARSLQRMPSHSRTVLSSPPEAIVRPSGREGDAEDSPDVAPQRLHRALGGRARPTSRTVAVRAGGGERAAVAGEREVFDVPGRVRPERLAERLASAARPTAARLRRRFPRRACRRPVRRRPPGRPLPRRAEAHRQRACSSTSQSRSVPSEPPEARVRPSGLKATLETSAFVAGERLADLLLSSRRPRAGPSRPSSADARTSPSGPKAMLVHRVLVALPSCPAGVPAGTSQSQIEPLTSAGGEQCSRPG